MLSDYANKHSHIVTDAILTVIDCNNRCSDELVAEGIVRALTESHRTLQAAFIRSLREALKMYPEAVGTDLRNEGAVAWAKEVTAIDTHIPYI